MAIGHIVLAFMGTMMIVVGLSSLYRGRTADDEELDLGPFERVVNLIGDPDSASTRRLAWTAIGLVTILTALLFFQLALTL